MVCQTKAKPTDQPTTSQELWGREPSYSYDPLWVQKWWRRAEQGLVPNSGDGLGGKVLPVLFIFCCITLSGLWITPLSLDKKQMSQKKKNSG